MNTGTLKLTVAFALAACLSATTNAQLTGNSRARDGDHGEKPRPWAREPFQHTVRNDWVEGSRTMSDSFQVPPNKRLVIEYVSGSYELPHGQEAFATVLWTVLNEQRDAHYIYIPKSGTFNTDVDNRSPDAERDLRPENELNIYAGGQQVRFYADPGSVVDIGVTRDDWICPFPCGTAIVTVSGYLMDARSPRLSP